jgi:hypothetical protein
MAVEHFAPHLRVTRLVGPDQSETSQAVEKQESTETG